MNLPILPTLARLVQDAQVAIPSDPTAEGTYWFPVQASTLAEKSDWTFYYIYWISAFFTAVIVAAMVFMAIRYRYRKGEWDGADSPGHSLALELTWSGIPFLLTIAMWYSGFKTYMYGDTPPPNGYEIQVKARQWSWEFIYPNGAKSDELHLPVNENVTFVMSSADVLHSFWIPAFRVKKDIVPGRYTKTWVNAIMEGQYTMFCTEYCGKDHSQMNAQVFVQDRASFDEWVGLAADPYGEMLPVEIGEKIYNQQCIACHTTDGTVRIGPSWQGIWGKESNFEDGTKLLVDENYIKESILDPGAKVVAGFPNAMTTYRGVFNDSEIDGLIAYIKSLGN
jgi:cytochrome c oxidase subunit 2